MLTEKEMPMLTKFEIDSCGKQLVIEETYRNIEDLRFEDPPTYEDVVMWTSWENEEQIGGRFSIETNSEVLYEVTYKKASREFFISTYTLTACSKVDSPREN